MFDLDLRLRPEHAARFGFPCAGEQLRDELEEQVHRQPDHVRQVAFDALDQARSEPLDGIGASAVAPLAEREVGVDQALGELAERDLRARDAGALLRAGSGYRGWGLRAQTGLCSLSGNKLQS